MIDHFNLPVSDLPVSSAFYEQALTPLNISPLLKEPDVVGFGKTNWEFGIVLETQGIAAIHLAFIADSVEQVKAFYHAALQAGGQCNGEPGFREEYGAEYYAAYVLDPDGHNVEAVCRHAGNAT